MKLLNAYFLFCYYELQRQLQLLISLALQFQVVVVFAVVTLETHELLSTPL